MDPNLLSRLEFFSGPNNQTVNTGDQAASQTGPTPAQFSPMWGASALAEGGGITEPTSTAPTNLSLDSFAQSSTPALDLSLESIAGQTPLHAQAPRPVLPARTPRTRQGNERKRSRLSTDVSPFDSVDYWVQFDKEEAILENPGADSASADLKMKGKAPMPQRSSNMGQGMTSASESVDPLKLDDTIDDSALDNAFSDEDGFSSMNLADHLSKIDSVPPSDIPPREGLYSTPLSWEKPQMGLRLDSLIGLPSPPSLNEAEQRRLIAIAMNPGSSMGGLGSNLGMNFGGLGPSFGTGLGTMGQATNMAPQPQPSFQRHAPPQPRTTRQNLEEQSKEKAKAGDRTAHNDIERKYRTNLKDKIAELRDAVPALRTIPEESVDDGEDGNQPSSGPKVSKGAVLTKATEYIHYLEKKNKMIIQQHQELSRRLQAFEQLLAATARPTFQMPNCSRTLFDPRAFC